MYDEQHFSRDTAVVEFDDSADGITTDDDGDVSFDWDEVDRVTVDNPPHADAFDSKEFYRLPATVAKPMPQPYQYGEDAVWLKKPREELKKAAWSLDNAPWTLGHPDNGMVKDVDDVHGFWSDPRYIDSLDDLDADLHIPVQDDEAKEFVEDNTDVSVGFYNRIERVDSYDGVVGGADDEDVDIEGYQTDMLFDHCASVKVGRCPGDAGCGIDAGPQGSMETVDSTHELSIEGQVPEGGVVEHDAIENLRGYVVHNPMDEPYYMVNVLQMEDGEWMDTQRTITAGVSDVWGIEEDGEQVMVWDVVPGISEEEMREQADAFKSGTVTTHKHDDAEGTADSDMRETTDAPEGIYEADGMWFAVAPDEHPDDSTEWADDAKFPVGSCEGVRDAWRLRGTGDISIDKSTLESRIKRAAEAQDCSMDFNEDVDPAAVADAAKRYSICGSRKEVMEDRDNCDCGSDSDNDTNMEFNFDDLSTEAALAKVSNQHDGVDERLGALEEAEETAETAEAAAEELDLDSVDDLVDTVAMLKEQKDSLEEKVDELQRPEMEEDAAFIAEHTDRFGDDAEAVIENLDEDPEAVADKRELVEELTEGYDEATANSGGSESEGGTTDTSGKYAKTPW
jgi:hypothetical protein